MIFIIKYNVVNFIRIELICKVNFNQILIFPD